MNVIPEKELYTTVQRKVLIKDTKEMLINGTNAVTSSKCYGGLLINSVSTERRTNFSRRMERIVRDIAM